MTLRGANLLGHSIRTFNGAIKGSQFPLVNSVQRLLSQGAAQTAGEDNEKETHFGFQTVKESEKDQKVYKVFEDVAKTYDLMNDITSLGIHRLWKDILVERLAPLPGTKLLDMAGGTGDIAFRFLKYLKNQPEGLNSEKKGHLTIADINQNMLDVGKVRAERLGYKDCGPNGETIEWVCSDAEKLVQFESNTFDAYTIAFGIRNCTHINQVIAEAYRVLKPGGRFLCLEFSQLTNEYLQYLYDQYSFQVIPPMGQILAGNWNAYQYLVESIRKFPKKEEFKKMIEDEGFKCVHYEDLTFGIISCYFKVVTEFMARLSSTEEDFYKVFEDVAKTYDLMNDITSLGIHRLWKDILVERLAPLPGTKLLDMAGGTGDIAFRFLKYLKNQPEGLNSEKKGHLTIADINQNMLDVGKVRAERLGYKDCGPNGETIEWVCSDAEKLVQFESNTFDAYTIAFGIRNCTHINQVIAEAYRVLKPGGRFLCLEFSQLTNEYLQYLYDQYSFQVIPPMGQILAGNWNAYQYLVESIRKFPKKEEFKKMIEDEGFKCVHYEDLTFGIVSIHSGFKF